jgi:transcription elongation factor GreB
VSKAFTKDDDGAEGVVIAPRRALLPDGVTNYVTPRGLTLLQAELEALARELPSTHQASELERARAVQLHQARLSELEARIHGAVVVHPEQQPKDEVRFGARVTLVTEAGATRNYRLVGVDEADARLGLLAFVSPLARALLGKRVGEVALVSTPGGEDELEIAHISYD